MAPFTTTDPDTPFPVPLFVLLLTSPFPLLLPLLSNRWIGLLLVFIAGTSSGGEKAHSKMGERHAEEELHPAEREEA